MKPEKKKLNLSISRVENRKEIKGLVSKDLAVAVVAVAQ